MSTAVHTAPAQHRRQYGRQPPGGDAATLGLPGVVVLGRCAGGEWILLTIAGVQLSLLVAPPTGHDAGARWPAGTGERLDFLARRLRAHHAPVTEITDGAELGLLLPTAAGDLLITELPSATKDSAEPT